MVPHPLRAWIQGQCNTNCVSHHDDDTNEQVSEDKVAKEEEGDGEELATLEPVQGELVLEISPPICL